MKHFKFGSLTIAASLIAFTLTSCSDDDGPNDPGRPSHDYPTAENVMKGKLLREYTEQSFSSGNPQPINRFTYSYNEKRQLIECIHLYGNFTRYGVLFDYENGEVRKTYNGNDDGLLWRFTTGDNQFVQTLTDDDRNTRDITYDKDGHFIAGFGKLTYENGDIVESMRFGETTKYTYTDHENKGLMMFDRIFNLDESYLDYLYFAGMLGRCTKHLPASHTCYYDEGTSSYTQRFEWTLDADGYPVKMVSRRSNNNNYYTEYTFTWE